MEFKTRKDATDRIDRLKRLRFEYTILKENDPVFQSLGKEHINNCILQVDRVIAELIEAHDRIPMGHFFEGTLYVLNYETKEVIPLTGKFFLKNGLVRWKQINGTMMVSAVKNKERTEQLKKEDGRPFYTMEEFKSLGGVYL